VSEALAGGTWTDTHCHVQASYLKDETDEGAVFRRATAAAVGRIVCVGTDEVASAEAVELARKRSQSGATPLTWATIGLHPHDAKRGLAPVERLLEENVSADRGPGAVVAVGECGLDYFYEYSPRDTQRVVFAEQIALAKRFDLALVVHTRDAWDETVDVLTAEGTPDRTVIHCFTGGPTEARRMLDLGACLSFSGIVTFKNADETREAARLCPADRLLVETDAPFLAPVPHRGHPNEPAFVALVGAAVAQLRNADELELAESTSLNATRLFRFEP
jgi:TatD DNase family protein